MHDFLLTKLLGTTWNRNKKQRAIAHYHRGSDNSLWWDDIKDDFRTIFGPVIVGLRVIHWNKLYHENLLDGVAVKGKGDDPSQDVLFNMMDHPNLCLLQSQNLITHQIQDIRHLIQLMKWFFPISVCWSNKASSTCEGVSSLFGPTGYWVILNFLQNYSNISYQIISLTLTFFL